MLNKFIEFKNLYVYITMFQVFADFGNINLCSTILFLLKNRKNEFNFALNLFLFNFILFYSKNYFRRKISKRKKNRK